MKNVVNYFLSALRILTGSLFLYEGIDKLLEPGWSARYYLLGSRWIFSGFFEWIAGSSFLMATVDFINVWGLIIIGLFLFIGFFTRWISVEGNFDDIKKVLELIRHYGKPAGIGAHRLETVEACVAQGIKPDFWVKTFHHHNYWSARVAPDQKDIDSIWCDDPQKTMEFMSGLEEPWIAFKVLAAGAIRPEEGFPAAFEAGADFICVGMYDFQIVGDSNIALDALASVKQRSRPWRG